MKQTNLKISRVTSLLTLILTLFVSFSQAQLPPITIPGGTLTAFPQDYQLYPRIKVGGTIQNYGVVTVAGTIQNSSGYTSLELRKYRDNNPGPLINYVLVESIPIALTYSGGTASFSVTNQLVAELMDYRYVLVANPGVGETLLADAERVLAGDVFIIQGQSNAIAQAKVGDANNVPNREFVRGFGNAHEKRMDNSPSFWGIANGNGNWQTNFAVGMWGMTLASHITVSEGIPIAIFNGAFGENINYFLKNAFDFNASIPQGGDGSNNYGRLLKRLTDAGVKDNVRAIFWWQGESDGLFDAIKPRVDYKLAFNNIFNAWKSDYPSIEKVFIIQIKMGCYGIDAPPPIETGLEIMQGQLELATQTSDPNVDFIIMSTQNLEHIQEPVGFPGEAWYCHYGYVGGYKKAADLFSPTVLQELYGATEEPNTRFGYPTAADVTAAGIITIEMSHPNDTYTITNIPGDPTDNIKNYFRLVSASGGGPFTINSVTTNGWKIIIDYSGTGRPDSVFYFGRHQWGGPAIENAGGQAVVAFKQAIIPSSLPVDPLSLNVNKNGGSNILRWKAENNERFYQFVIERGETRNNFKPIAEIYGTGQDGTAQYSYTDNKPNPTVSHYRIRAIQHDDKVVYSQVVTVNNRLNTVKEFRVFPNPVAGSANATIHLQDAAMATIHLHDASGRLLTSRKLQLQKGNNQFSLGELLDYGPGTYIVRVITPTETQQVRVVKAK